MMEATLALPGEDTALSDDELVEDAKEASAEAEQAEAEAGSPHRWRMADRYFELSHRGWTQQQIAKRCEVSQQTVSRYVRLVGSYSLVSSRPTFWEAIKALEGRAHVSANSGDNEWYTPEPYIEAAVAVMGAIDLDPASTETANTVVGAATFYTAEQDGLTQRWEGRVWMNPPYARPLIDSFAAKLADAYSMGEVTEACVLVNNGTETGWFHTLAEVAGAMCFPRQRVKFWHPEKESAPLQGQAVIYLGPNVEAFREQFVRFGFTASL